MLAEGDDANALRELEIVRCVESGLYGGNMMYKSVPSARYRVVFFVLHQDCSSVSCVILTSTAFAEIQVELENFWRLNKRTSTILSSSNYFCCINSSLISQSNAFSSEHDLLREKIGLD